MCTVTFIARRHGHILGMNRDEKLSRTTALPPARHRLGRGRALFPSEPNAGTWVGVNDSGVTFALINWYSVPPGRVINRPISRGEVVKLALSSDSSGPVDMALATVPLVRVNPFRLIGVFPARRAVVEWRWDLKRLECLDHPWRTHIWISSGFDEPGAQEMRGRTFGQSLRSASAGHVEWLRRLHASHSPACGPYSICMHRDDAATVSYTEVIVSRRRAVMRYAAGAPCVAERRPAFYLPINH